MAGLLMGSQPKGQVKFAGKRSQKEQGSFTSWNVGGWAHSLECLRVQYENRMNRIYKTLDDGRMQLLPFPESVNSGVVVPTSKYMYKFHWPRGDVSVCIRTSFWTHPLYSQFYGIELSNLFWMRLQKLYRVLVTPSQIFSSTNATKEEEG